MVSDAPSRVVADDQFSRLLLSNLDQRTSGNVYYTFMAPEKRRSRYVLFPNSVRKVPLPEA